MRCKEGVEPAYSLRLGVGCWVLCADMCGVGCEVRAVCSVAAGALRLCPAGVTVRMRACREMELAAAAMAA